MEEKEEEEFHASNLKMYLYYFFKAIMMVS